MAVDAAPPFAHVAIVGYGLVGASLGMAIRERWPGAMLIAIDRKHVIETAMRMQAADVGGDDLVLAAGADLIVLAAPVLANIELLSRLADVVPDAAVVTDVGSTKRDTVAAARALPARLRFVGGHPLAGAAVGGIEHARPDLFAGRPWFLTPEGEQDDSVLADFLRQLGADVRVTTPEAHDALLAYISHLPQLATSALMAVVGATAGEDGLAVAGRGLRETTRLASSPSDIWQDIAGTNSDHLARALDDLLAVLGRLRANLTAGSVGARGGVRRRSRLEAGPRGALQAAMITVSRTRLEMRDARQLRPAAMPAGDVSVERASPTPSEWRDLYMGVGGPHHWVDRLAWSDRDIAAYLSDPAVAFWMITVEGRAAGYFELRRGEDASVEIAYFGLLPEFQGRGLGGYLLTIAAEQAWAIAAQRVWLHTCTLDHAAALPNYLKRGFVVVKVEQYIVAAGKGPESL